MPPLCPSFRRCDRHRRDGQEGVSDLVQLCVRRIPWTHQHANNTTKTTYIGTYVVTDFTAMLKYVLLDSEIVGVRSHTRRYGASQCGPLNNTLNPSLGLKKLMFRTYF
jgi:hypothetical protein